MSPTVPPWAKPCHDAAPNGWVEASAPEAGRFACGGGRMCVSLRETVGDMDVDDEATWTYSRRVSRRDTHIRCAPSRKRGTRLRAQGALLRGSSPIVMTPPATRPPALPVGRSDENTSELPSLMRTSHAVINWQ